MASPARVEKFLGGVDYPCSKQDLVDTAIDNGADDDVVGMLRRMPGTSFDNPNEVTRAIGQLE